MTFNLEERCNVRSGHSTAYILRLCRRNPALGQCLEAPTRTPRIDVGVVCGIDAAPCAPGSLRGVTWERAAVGERDNRLLALVVDDDLDTREMYGTYLKTSGLRVLLATNGIEAIEVSERERPDVIVMDLMMPHLDGWEASRRLKADGRTRRIPIIACTGVGIGPRWTPQIRP